MKKAEHAGKHATKMEMEPPSFQKTAEKAENTRFSTTPKADRGEQVGTCGKTRYKDGALVFPKKKAEKARNVKNARNAKMLKKAEKKLKRLRNARKCKKCEKCKKKSEKCEKCEKARNTRMQKNARSGEC